MKTANNLSDYKITATPEEILEAIKKVNPYSKVDGDEYVVTLRMISIALSTLPRHSEREVKCKDCNDSGQVPIGEEQGQLLYADCPCQFHPSKREVLMGFVKWCKETGNNASFSSVGIYERYLTEKKGGEG